MIYLSNKLILMIAKEHQREIMITGMDDAISCKRHQSTDVGKHPHHTLVEQLIISEVFVTIKLLEILSILGF